MDKNIKQQYIAAANKLEGKDYIAAMIAYNAAPTVKSLKPASLINFTIGRKNRIELWKFYKDEICKELNLEYIELREKSESLIVMFYKKELLEWQLSKPGIKAFLEGYGYQGHSSLYEKLCLLKERFLNSCPDEVGIFLGYPLEDIIGFIKNQGRNSIMCRYWKVYTNPRQAQELFKNYDTAKVSIATSIILNNTISASNINYRPN